jgi:hypothetical protein
MNAKEALELKYSRERALAEIEDALPEGRKAGELPALLVILRHQHKLLTRYESMKDPPAIAESMVAEFAAYAARIDELLAVKEG